MSCGFEEAWTELWYKVEPSEQETERCLHGFPFETSAERLIRFDLNKLTSVLQPMH